MNPNVPAQSPEIPASEPPATDRSRLWILALLLFVLGAALRIYPSAGFTQTGFDEALYRDYVLKVDKVGVWEYPAICELYIEDQRKAETMAKLPPTRFLYVLCGWVWKRAEFGSAPPASRQAAAFAQEDPALVSLHRVSCLFSILLLAAAGAWSWRIFPPAIATSVLALMCFAPLQIHMSQHALIDGFLAFWATLCLWTLWECLQKPAHSGWLAAHGVSLALMVMTKENAFFVYVALVGIVATARWMKLGKVTGRLLLVMFLGPLAGLTLLIALAGGVGSFIEIYRLLVSKAHNLQYAIMTGDGPWHRYLIDMLIVSPVILCLAIGALFTSAKASKPLLYLSAFIAFSYLIMCNVKYGMNLRYATIWDLPLRALAAVQVWTVAGWFGRRQALVGVILIAAICAYELRQYVVFFKDFGLYELVTEGLLRAVKVLK